MKVVFTWLMVFCVLAGLNVRSLGADDHHRLVPCPHEVDSCSDDVSTSHHHHDDHGHHHENHDGDHDGKDHHHHHECCSQAQPLGMENQFICRLGPISGSSLLGVRHEGETTPEEPFLGSEKPPLI
jgi:hypothetical protein